MLTTSTVLNPHRPANDTLRTIGKNTLRAFVAVLLLGSASAIADGPSIIRVEEDWELAIAAPDPEANAPQVICVFGPDNPEQGTHAVFEMNHATLPDFTAGGMQLQCWWQNQLILYQGHPNLTEFEAAIDTVTFTTVTEVAGGKLTMEIINGNSQTWGSFGGQGYLKVSLNTWRHDLDGYNASHSVAHSRVTFGANRVNRLVRREVRYYSTEGLVATDTDDVFVHQLLVDLPE